MTMFIHYKETRVLKSADPITATSCSKSAMHAVCIALVLCMFTGLLSTSVAQVTTGGDQTRKSLDRDTLLEGMGILFMIADLPSGDDVLTEKFRSAMPGGQVYRDGVDESGKPWDEQYVVVASELQRYDDESIVLLFEMFFKSHDRLSQPLSRTETDVDWTMRSGGADTKLFILNRLIYEPNAKDAPSPMFWRYTASHFFNTDRRIVDYMFPLVEFGSRRFSIRDDFVGALGSFSPDNPIQELKYFAREFPRRRL